MKFPAHQVKKYRLIGFILLSTLMWTCNKEETYFNLPIYGPEQPFYALTGQNGISSYNAKDVRNVNSTAIITGLAASELILSIDFRPATGELYGISSLSRLYIIDPASGTAKAVSSVPFVPEINGSTISMDFNPVEDRIRVVSNTGQNFRLNPETGMVDGTDPNITTSSILGIAYSNNYAGAAITTLFDLDVAAKKLHKQEPQNSGTLVNVGSLQLDLGTTACFDIAPNEKALAVARLADSTKLYVVNLSTGKATLSGKFASGTSIRAIAIPTTPAAYAIDDTNNLLIFNPTLGVAPYIKPITGLQNGETIYGMDIRPSNGQLFALGSSNRLYRLNMGTGAATRVGSGPLLTTLSGTAFGFDFNPLTDMIQVVSNTGQNLKIDPNTTVVTAGPNVISTAAAFSNNFRVASSTLLYLIDHTTDKLSTQNQNSGVLTEIGPLNIDISAANGFDIVYNTQDIAYGIFTVAGKTSFYDVNLTNGAATKKFDFSKPVTALAVGLRFN